MYRPRQAEEEPAKVDPTKLRFDASAIAKYKVKGPGELSCTPLALPLLPFLRRPDLFLLHLIKLRSTMDLFISLICLILFCFYQ
jgi:hypothetical protein